MQYYSTNNKNLWVDFREATIKGQPSDKGLFFPQHIPALSKKFINDIEQFSKEEIAFEVIKPYVGNTIPDDELKRIVAETINFEIPLVTINDSISTLELFHGPTLAFKDVGARFMSRCLSYFFKDSDKKITVLVAMSGDTGGAVAAAFYDVENVEVVILYPSGKVSSIQELQLTTLGKNIRAIKVDGSFDDCQRMVKHAFTDKELNSHLFLTSANSINVARWLPQQVYYFYAWQQWPDKKTQPVIAVPSGNFGNICAGLLAYRSGLPVHQFIAACNANDAVPHFFTTEKYQAKPTVATLSNAMDVGDPSNFIRVLELFDHNVESLKEIITPYSISDTETKQTIQELSTQQGYTPDPHGAVAYKALEQWLQNHRGRKGYFLETAHPVKFYDVVEPVIHRKIELPLSIQLMLSKQKESVPMKADAEQLKAYLLTRLKKWD
ncbi:MAG TPA: threonine synthase [Flavisolibacter sp.]|nr:threonine synthase [Flavisolibacter sp.]